LKRRVGKSNFLDSLFRGYDNIYYFCSNKNFLRTGLFLE